MKRSVVARLRDMLAAIDAAAEMIEGQDLAAYRSDLKLRLAIERCVEIVSEASRFVPDDDKERFPEVPWVEIAAIGDKLRHEDNRIDDVIIWRVASSSLPTLRPVIVCILADEGDRSRSIAHD